MRIGIVGAGLIGLTAGWQLARAGHQVSIFEQADATGGLAGTFEYEGTRLEKFYHHYFISDLDTVQIIKDMGLEDKMIWRETPMGVYTGGKTYKFSTPVDLLKFKPLSFIDRIRFGAVTLLLSMTKNWKKFEHVKAEKWLKKYYGKQGWDVMWGPLLHGKFGRYAPEIGMPWFYSRVHNRAGSREKGMTKESLGYLEGSMQVLHDALQKRIESLGGKLFFNQAVTALEIRDEKIKGIRTADKSYEFDRVLTTMAPQALTGLLPNDLKGDYWSKLKQSEYIGNVCAIITLKRSLSPIYWMNIPDLNSPFIAVIEHTNFVDQSHYHDKHVLYLSSYIPADHPRYKADDQEVLREFYDYLKKIITDFKEADVEAHHVFRAPFAQPIIRAGYASNIVPVQSPVKGLLIANMAQIYPEDRGMSYSIKLGKRAAEEILKAAK